MAWSARPLTTAISDSLSLCGSPESRSAPDCQHWPTRCSGPLESLVLGGEKPGVSVRSMLTMPRTCRIMHADCPWCGETSALGPGKEVSRVDELESVSFHTVHLSGLKPGHRRDARVASGFHNHALQRLRTCSLKPRSNWAPHGLGSFPSSSSPWVAGSGGETASLLKEMEGPVLFLTSP